MPLALLRRELVPSSLQFRNQPNLHLNHTNIPGAFFRLGLQLLAVTWTKKCDCGATFDEMEYSLLVRRVVAQFGHTIQWFVNGMVV